jgi:hypothetical protein
MIVVPGSASEEEDVAHAEEREDDVVKLGRDGVP